MLSDRRGLPVTADNKAAVSRLDDAIAAFAGHQAATGSLLEAALAADGDFLLAHCLRGFCAKLLARQELDEIALTAEHWARLAARRRGATAREMQYIAALSAWCEGEMGRAGAILAEIVRRQPLDLLALKLHHAVHFMLGDRAAMLETAEGARPAWSAGGIADDGYILGCLAFALEESGDYDAALAAGLAACERQRGDAWAIHAVAHVHLMRGEPRAGLAWLAANEADLACCNNFAYHVQWHAALFHLELGEAEAALALYDERVRAAKTDDFRDIANAVSLLWRLERAGIAVGARWEELADKAEARVGDPSLAFATLHYLMALAGAGRLAGAEMMLRAMRLRAKRHTGCQAAVLREIGVSAGEAILAARRGEHGRAVELLFAARGRVRRLGGSNAQRELFDRCLAESAGRSGRREEARQLRHERLRRWAGDAEEEMESRDPALAIS
jgi:hypothetical protein